MFETANEDSLYFGNKMSAQLKCIRRYLASACLKVASAKDADLQEAEK